MSSLTWEIASQVSEIEVLDDETWTGFHHFHDYVNDY